MLIVSKLRPRRRLRLVEQASDFFFLTGGDDRVSESQTRFRFVAGAFVAEGGGLAAGEWKRAEVELVLSDRRFLFPQFQAPRKASEFLDAIVGSQIDRLTPWSRAQAEAGFATAPSTSDETTVTLAAASKAALDPYVEGARARGADSVVVFAARPDEAPIRVCAREVNRNARARNYRRALVAALAAAVLFALGSSALESWYSDQRQTAQAEIARRIAAMRTNADSAAQDPQLAALLQRKRGIPPAVVILDALSRALPDDSYLTQLRISGARVEIDGVSRSASSLVALLEQTEPFQRAQFSAPTTPAAAQGAEEFHIAADIATAMARSP
jgi:general secretion pathway protein L